MLFVKFSNFQYYNCGNISILYNNDSMIHVCNVFDNHTQFVILCVWYMWYIMHFLTQTAFVKAALVLFPFAWFWFFSNIIYLITYRVLNDSVFKFCRAINTSSYKRFIYQTWFRWKTISFQQIRRRKIW